MTALVGSFATSKLRRRLSTIGTTALVCLASIVLLEIDGYVGPFASATNMTLAVGYESHKLIDGAPLDPGEVHDLTASAQFAQNRKRTSGTRWAFINPYSSFTCQGAEEWFWALSGELSLSGLYGEWNDLPCSGGEGDVGTATFLVSYYPTPVASRIHLFVSASLARAILVRNKAWSAPDVLHILPTR